MLIVLLPRWLSTAHRGPGDWVPAPLFAAVETDTTGSPTFPGDPAAFMLRSSTPVGLDALAVTRRPDCLFRDDLPLLIRRRSHNDPDFGAQSRSLKTRCLRFAAWVTPGPRKTRFCSVASLPGGILTRQGPSTRFPFSISYIASPLSELRGANQDQVFEYRLFRVRS